MRERDSSSKPLTAETTGGEPAARQAGAKRERVARANLEGTTKTTAEEFSRTAAGSVDQSMASGKGTPGRKRGLRRVARMEAA